MKFARFSRIPSHGQQPAATAATATATAATATATTNANNNTSKKRHHCCQEHYYFIHYYFNPKRAKTTMGGTISLGPSSMSERKRKLRMSKKEQERANEEESRRRRLLEQYGVLIPPVFLANKTDDPPLSSRAWERFLRESSSSAQLQQQQQHGSSDLLLWAYRRTKRTANDDDDFDAGPLLGQTLLTEYTTPGLFLSLPIASSGANDGGRFLAALTQQPFSEKTPLPSFLSLTKCFHKNSFLFFPFPWKVETFLPQHALLSNATAATAGILPSSMRFTADLSSPANNNKNRTQVAWTTHFLNDQDSGSSRSIGGQPSLSRLWTKLRGSWIEAETVRPDFLNSGITLRAASSMTLDCFLDNVVLETCRVGNDAYHDYTALESNKSNNTFKSFLRKFRKQKRQEGNHQDDNVRVRLAAEYKESIIASSTNLSLSSLLGRGTGSIPVVTVTDTLLSLNLNGGGNDETDRQQQQPSPPPPPPLWLTLKQSKSYTDSTISSWCLNLSQVVTFDREIWNILEDRAPKVRNHVGWVCQIERFLNHKNGGNQNHDGNASSSSPSSSVLSVGASAQFNRNIAAKVILESKIGSSSPSATTSALASPSSTPSAALKFAVVFKRWLEPNASLSVIQKIDLLTGKWSFLGVGLEIEQHKQIGGASSSKSKSKQQFPNKDSKKRGAEYRDTADMDSTSSVAPPTRVQVEMPGGKN
jgi:hypothetical protein